jgi:sugar phosphate isomerase/epimerase
MPIPIALQLYSLRDSAAKDFAAVLKTVADMGYRGVELAGFHGKSAAEVATMIRDVGLEVAGGHMAMPSKDNIQQLVDDCNALGTKMIVTGFGPNDYATEADTRKNASRFEQAGALAAKNGLKLGYHNHWWEFDRKFGGKTPHEILMKNCPSVFAEVDVYWVIFGGGDAAAVIKSLKGRTPLLHIKDGPLEKDKPHTAVGAGKLDMPTIIGAADPATTKWLIVELDSCATDMTQAVRDSYDYLVSQGLAAGRK